MSGLAAIRKAIAAAILAGGPMLLATLQDQTPGGSTVTAAEGIAVVVTALLALAGVYAIPNSPPSPMP
jgi:hypothetical protein